MAKRIRHNKKPQDKPHQKPPDASSPDNSLAKILVPLGLVVLLAIVYLTTILPGVSSGDSAELQYKSPLLGFCHPPGYQIEVMFGKLFSLLPLGPSVAWRINLMMTVFGIIGVLALYGALRRISGQFLPAVVAALTLAFSSIYWSHCLVAEAYVFYATFLLLGIYTVTRFVAGNKAGWLYLAALFLGACVADRASELFVMPSFLLLWWAVRKKVNLLWLRLPLSLLIFVMPFFVSLNYHLIRRNTNSLHRRDNSLRDNILSGKQTTPPPRQEKHLSLAQRYDRGIIQGTIRYCLGLNYTKQAQFDPKNVGPDIGKYAWLLSGRGAFGDGNRFSPENVRGNLDQGVGSSIGILGVLLAPLGIIFWRRNYGWPLLGLGLFVGNFIFYLWHHTWDNLTFIIPGLIGWCLLIGLASAVSPQNNRTSRHRMIYQLVCLVVPAFLLFSNYRLLDQSTSQTAQLLEYNNRIAAAPFPPDSVIITSCWPAMTYRYLLYIEAQRKDIYVIYADQDKWSKLIEYFQKHSRPVFLRSDAVNPQIKNRLLKNTPVPLAQLGFVMPQPPPAENQKP